MTRLAVGTPQAPQMSGVFIASARAVVAALLSAAFLLATRTPWPRRADWRAFAGVALVFSVPINLPLAALTWPAVAITVQAWGAFAYVAVFSMWLGFFAWYRALALGGTVRVSQVQLIQPFLSTLFAVPLLGESLDALTIGFGLAVMAVVFIGRKMPVSASHGRTALLEKT